MKYIVKAFLAVSILASAFCTSGREPVIKKDPIYVESAFGEKMVVDGRLDEKVWKKGSWQTLGHCPDKKYRPRVQNIFDKGVQEKTYFKLARDKKYLYIGVKAMDSDIVGEGKRDQEHLYKYGDVIEIFLKSEKAPGYWEIYIAPNNKKTVFFYPSQGRFGLQSNWPKVCPFKKFQAKAYLKGTLNDYSDKDQYWTAEFALPIDEIEEKTVKFLQKNKWTFLIYRPNYSWYLPWSEPTMYPNIQWNCHAFENYAPLIFRK